MLKMLSESENKIIFENDYGIYIIEKILVSNLITDYGRLVISK